MNLRYCSLAKISALLAFMAPTVPALSQSDNPFLGRWGATWENKGGQPLQANVEITENGGSWQTLAARRHDPCVGKQAPIQIKSVSPSAMDFSIRYSEVLQGCKDANVRLTRHEDGRVTGQRGADIALVLTRK